MHYRLGDTTDNTGVNLIDTSGSAAPATPFAQDVTAAGSLIDQLITGINTRLHPTVNVQATPQIQNQLLGYLVLGAVVLGGVILMTRKAR